MQDIIKYVMAEAAKSNVEKRQVGCIITGTKLSDGKEEIVARGHNIEEQETFHPEDVKCVHAEAMACEDFVASAVEETYYNSFKVYVSHPPCPECAQLLARHGFTDIEVVEAFMKFDGDKLRYDLVDGAFLLKFTAERALPDLDLPVIRHHLWAYQKDQGALINAIKICLGYYHDFQAFEDALARVLTFGARKYKPNNWKKCEDTGRYLAAAHRHLIALISGEQEDPETGFSHMDHVITNLMFLWVLEVNHDN